MEKKEKKTRSSLYTSILLLLMAVAAVTATTIAWLSIADSTRVKSMSLDVTSGASLRFDLDPHDTFEQYVMRLNFSQIAQRMQSQLGFNMRQEPLKPVTTTNYKEFTFEDGTVVPKETGAYLTFELNFMSTRDMMVHLSSASGTNQNNKTNVTSSNSKLPPAMRIAFTTDGSTSIYNPGMGAGSKTEHGGKMFGLPSGGMTYSNDNALFSLKEGVNKVVLLHIWLEGTDKNCTDELRGVDYSISLRFEGTDGNNQEFGSSSK